MFCFTLTTKYSVRLAGAFCKIKIILQEAGDMNENLCGYVRVSSKDQNEERQVIALREFGVPDENIIVEKQSGKDFNRPKYLKLVAGLTSRDVLVVMSIDRLGRSYGEILEQWRIITKEKQAAIVVVDMPLLDTRKGRDLTGTLISDIVLQLLSYVAETERAYIKKRQAEGIAAAKARGVRFGASPKPRPNVYDEVFSQWEERKISARTAAKLCGVTHNTFLKWASEDNQKVKKQ